MILYSKHLASLGVAPQVVTDDDGEIIPSVNTVSEIKPGAGPVTYNLGGITVFSENSGEEVGEDVGRGFVNYMANYESNNRTLVENFDSNEQH